METKSKRTSNLNKGLTFVVAPSAKETIFELAKKHHWAEPILLREGGMIETPLVEEKWRYEPLINYFTLPRAARKRIELILKSVPIEGIILAHEIEVAPVKPKVKPLPWVVAPEPAPWRFPQPQTNPLKEVDWKAVGKVAWDVTKIISLAALGVLAVLGILFGAFAGCMTDPAVIVVVEGVWLEIYRYY